MEPVVIEDSGTWKFKHGLLFLFFLFGIKISVPKQSSKYPSKWLYKKQKQELFMLSYPFILLRTRPLTLHAMIVEL